MPTYTIKPLAWDVKGRGFYSATVPMGNYYIYTDEDGSGVTMRYCFDEYYDEDESTHDSLEAAKQAAWEDWLARIWPALEEVNDG